MRSEKLFCKVVLNFSSGASIDFTELLELEFIALKFQSYTKA